MSLYKITNKFFAKTVSSVLAVLFLLSPLDNVSFANNEELTPWSYDTANVRSQSIVSGKSGDYSESYELSLPDGVNGLIPSININYTSQSNNYNSYLGYGWDINIPKIQRINKNGIDKMYNRDDYYSSFDGELSKVSSGTYRSDVDYGEFRLYEKNSLAWEVSDKSGLKYTFGSSTGDRQDDSASTTKVFAWYLSEVEDADGNKIVYEYIKSNGQIYPDKIYYSYSNENPAAEINFIYSSTTPYVTYISGFAITNERVLENIEVYFDGQLLFNYDLEYDSEDYSNINLLSSIQKFVYSENTIVSSSSPRLFEYTTNSSVSWQNDSSVANTVPKKLFGEVFSASLNDTYYYRSLLIDINGDGLNDWISEDEVQLNNGEGWEATSSWPTLPKSNWHKENRIVDVDGDMLPDIITSKEVFYSNENIVQTRQVKINQGDGTWVSDPDWASTTPGNFLYVDSSSGYEEYEKDVYITDINGDGLNDWLYSGEVFLNTGYGWEATSSWPALPSGSVNFDKSWRMADINGDGLPDIIKAIIKFYDQNLFEGTPEEYQYSIYFNKGDGTWLSDPDWASTIPTELWNYLYNTDLDGTYSRRYIADINGDGLADWLSGVTAYLNTGSGWSTTSTITLPVNSSSLVKDYRLVDINGDSQLDFVRYYYKYYYGAETNSRNAYINNSNKLWLLSTTTDEKGGITSVTYDVTSKKDGGVLTNPTLPFVKYVVSEIKTDSLYDNDKITEYDYSDGFLFFSTTSVFDRKFAGFGKVTKTTDLGKEVTYYHQGNGLSTTSEESVDGESLIGKAYRVEITDLSGNLYTVSRNNYATTSLGASSTFVYLDNTLKLDYDGDGDHKDSAAEYEYDMNHGGVLKLTELGEVSGGTDGTYSDTGTDKKVTDYTYATSTNGLVAPTSEIVKDQSNNKVKESKYYYDNLSFGSVNLGNLTKQEDWIDGSNYVDRLWSYNSYGLPTSETDANGNTTVYGYDTYNLFVASSTNAMGHNTQYEYDYSVGKVGTTTDANGKVYVNVYDGFGRLLEEKIPDPQTGSLVLKTKNVYTDTSGAVSVKTSNYLDSSIINDKYSYHDGFGRLIQERTEAEDANQYVVRDYVYGDDGLLEKESLPYFDTGVSRSSATTNDDLFSEYTYDPLQRVTLVETAVGDSTTSYDQWIETVTDSLGNNKDFVSDAYGRLTKVVEHNNSNEYETDYEWDHNGNLTKITDELGNVRGLSYDGLSRRTSIEDLHNPSDTSFGEWSFAYDDNGNLISKTDPKSQTINYAYDDINRVFSKDFTGAVGIEMSYVYDICTNGVGRLCSAINNSATSTYTYNHTGSLKTETKVIDETSYATEYEYDRLGNQTLITYPDDSEVQYTYNDANMVEIIEQKELGGSFADIVSDFDYGPHGQITYQLFGNGAYTDKTYDQSGLYRLSNISTVSTTTYGVGGPGIEHELIEAEFADVLEFDSILAVSVVAGTSTEPETPEGDAEVVELESVLPDEEVMAVAVTGSVNGSGAAVATDTEKVSVDETLLDKNYDLGIKEYKYSEYLVDISSEDSGRAIFSSTTDSVSSINIFDEEDTLEFKNTNSILPVDVKDELVNLKVKERLDYVIENKVDKQKFYDNKDRLEVNLKYNEDKNHHLNVAIQKEKNGIRLNTWGDEVSLGVTYKSMLTKSSSVYRDNIYRWVGVDGEQELHAYPLPPADGMEEGGFEIEVLLKSEPKDNVFEFQIDGYEDLDFFYQPPLTKKEISEGTSMDEKFVGSYAVFHKFKKDYKAGEVNYRNGLVFHIYRPKIYDIEGNQVWGELGYEDGVLSVTVPKDFLKIAKYPIVIDPTFGKTSTGGYNGYVGNSTIAGSRFTAPENGEIYRTHVYESSYSGHPEATMAIYNTSGWKPTGSDLISTSHSTSTIGGWSWRSFDTVAPVASNTPYWIISWINSTGYYNYSVTSSDSDGFKTSRYNGTFPIWTDPFSYGNPTMEKRRYTLYAEYSLPNSVPDEPTSLEVEGQADPVNITDDTPEFSAIYNDPDLGDVATHYQIQVATTSSFTPLYWDSGSTTLSTSTLEGERSEEIVYGGPPLVASTTYYWRIKLWDDSGADGPWSASTSTFSLVEVATTSSSSTSQVIAVGGVQNLSYTYDSVGNITEIVDTSETNSSATTTYVYDDLYRLTSASTTLATTTPYTRTYTYNSLGNIVTKSDQGTYTYNGHTGNNYANPHAVTSINGTTYSYDQNGNLASTTNGIQNTWSYQNQLLESNSGSATTSYGYDHNGDRVFKTTSEGTAYYPFGNYEITDTGTTTKHIYAGDMLVATIEGSGAGALTYHNHLDHLNSTRAVTDGIGALVSELDFFPYGDTRIDNDYGDFRQHIQHTGHQKDDSTGLIYRKARYYDGETGRFTSMDPYVFKDLTTIINDPQLLNTYGYARNNPLIYDDPNGEIPNKVQATSYDSIASIIRSYETNLVLTREGVLDKVTNHYRNAPDNASNPRYVYTDSRGWIDGKHFFTAANETGNYGGLLTRLLGFGVEIQQKLDGSSSAFSYEDLPSNYLGTKFYDYVQNAEDGRMLSELYTDFMKQSGAMSPTDSPSYDSLPDEVNGDAGDTNWTSRKKEKE